MTNSQNVCTPVFYAQHKCAHLIRVPPPSSPLMMFPARLTFGQTRHRCCVLRAIAQSVVHPHAQSQQRLQMCTGRQPRRVENRLFLLPDRLNQLVTFSCRLLSCLLRIQEGQTLQPDRSQTPPCIRWRRTAKPPAREMLLRLVCSQQR